MKKLIATFALLLSLGGCRTETRSGQCHGVFDVQDEKPNLEYRASTRNIVLGVIFFETIFAPILAFGYDMYCPTGPK